MDLDYLPHLFGEAYAEVYPSLTANDPRYPSPETLLERTFLGNYEFEGDTRFETDGSRFIASCLLDDDPRTLYLEAWGGSNTVARALMSIEETYRDTAEWESVYQKVCDKGVLISFGDREASIYNGAYRSEMDVWQHNTLETSFTVPVDAQPGDLFNLLLSVTDDSVPALTRYAQVIVTVTAE